MKCFDESLGNSAAALFVVGAFWENVTRSQQLGDQVRSQHDIIITTGCIVDEQTTMTKTPVPPLVLCLFKAIVLWILPW